MKTRILSIVFFTAIAIAHSQTNTFTGNWNTNTAVRTSAIIVTPLKSDQILMISSTPVNESNHSGTIVRRGKGTLPFHEGGGALFSTKSSTYINYFNNNVSGNLVAGTYTITNFGKLRTSTATWALRNSGGPRSVAILDVDQEVFFAVKVNNLNSCQNTQVQFRLDGQIIDVEQNSRPTIFIPGQSFVGYGKKIDVILVSSNCVAPRFVYGEVSIYK